MSHHYSGPEFGFPHADARLDFTDLYAGDDVGAHGDLLAEFPYVEPPHNAS